MDPVSVRFTRSALIWLVSGFVVGALMLSDELVPGDWRAWLAPTHGHMLFVGWFMQFAVGIAYWLLPRKRVPERPLGYDERLATLGFVLLNAGLLLRVLFEPAPRIGYLTGIDEGGRALSAVLQLAAIAIIAAQLRGRLRGRLKAEGGK